MRVRAAVQLSLRGWALAAWWPLRPPAPARHPRAWWQMPLGRLPWPAPPSRRAPMPAVSRPTGTVPGRQSVQPGPAPRSPAPAPAAACASWPAFRAAHRLRARCATQPARAQCVCGCRCTGWRCRTAPARQRPAPQRRPARPVRCPRASARTSGPHRTRSVPDPRPPPHRPAQRPTAGETASSSGCTGRRPSSRWWSCGPCRQSARTPSGSSPCSRAPGPGATWRPWRCRTANRATWPG